MIKRCTGIIAALLMLTLVFGLVNVGGVSPFVTTAYAANDENEDESEEEVSEEEEEETSVKKPTVKTASTTSGSAAYSHKSLKAGIKKYAADNKDVKGWLIVPNTNISKPVAFSAKDNSYYAYRDIKGVNYPNTTYSNFKETATYLDCRVVFGSTWKKSSKNTVLYGHNWTNLREPVAVGANNNHIMFGQLPSYASLDFAKSNPHVYFSTNELEGVWRVFSVAYVELSTNFNYNQPNPTNEDYEKLLKELKARSVHNFDVDVKSSDRIITLSTCTRQYNMGANQRFIVVARLLRDGEKDTDTVTVKTNPSPKKPQL